MCAANKAKMSKNWAARPKLHMIDHSVRDAIITGYNPAFSWAFQEEDNVGRVVKVCQVIHGASLERRSLERWVTQFFLY